MANPFLSPLREDCHKDPLLGRLKGHFTNHSVAVLSQSCLQCWCGPAGNPGAVQVSAGGCWTRGGSASRPPGRRSLPAPGTASCTSGRARSVPPAATCRCHRSGCPECAARWGLWQLRRGMVNTRHEGSPAYLENVEHPALLNSSFNKPLNSSLPAVCSEVRPQEVPFPALHKLSPLQQKPLPQEQAQGSSVLPLSSQPQRCLPREIKIPFTHVVNSSGDDHICILLCLQNRNSGRGGKWEKSASFQEEATKGQKTGQRWKVLVLQSSKLKLSLMATTSMNYNITLANVHWV